MTVRRWLEAGIWGLLALAALGTLPASGAPAPAVPVSVMRVTHSTLQTDVPLIGSVIARRTSRISPQVEGLVQELFVDRGMEVAAGAALFRLDARLAEIDVQRAQAELAVAQAQLADAERALNEARQLRQNNHISQTAFEAARIGVESAEAGAARQQAALARQQELLRRHTVVAPFAGAVVDKFSEVGQWVRSDTAVVEVSEVDTVRVEVPVPQRVFGALQVGMPSNVSFDALPGRQFSGTISARIPAGQAAARTFPVWIDVVNQERLLAPGMSARVAFALPASGPVALAVPNDALVRDASGGAVVWVLKGDEAPYTAVRVSVQVGRVGERLTEVQGDSLSAADLVVVRGNETLRPQQSVRIAEMLGS